MGDRMGVGAQAEGGSEWFEGSKLKLHTDGSATSGVKSSGSCGKMFWLVKEMSKHDLMQKQFISKYLTFIPTQKEKGKATLAPELGWIVCHNSNWSKCFIPAALLQQPERTCRKSTYLEHIIFFTNITGYVPY